MAEMAIKTPYGFRLKKQELVYRRPAKCVVIIV